MAGGPSTSFVALLKRTLGGLRNPAWNRSRFPFLSPWEGRIRVLRLCIAGTALLLLSCADNPVGVEPEHGVVSGTVRDAATMAPLAGVAISTVPATSSVITGEDGRFTLADV